MESINKKNKIGIWQNLKGLDNLYQTISNLIKSNMKVSFNLTMFSFDMENLNLKYSTQIKLFDQISKLIKNYLEEDIELFQFDQNKIITLSFNASIKNTLVHKLQSEKFNIDDIEISLSPQAVETIWPKDGKDFDSLLDKLLQKLKNIDNNYEELQIPTHPDSVLINQKGDFIDKVEKVSTQLYLIAKDKNIEIIKQNIISDRSFQVRGGDEGNFELFYILDGKVKNEDNDLILKRGDSISAKCGDQEKYFKTVTDTTLLYITSNPIFASERKRIKDLLSLNERIAEKDIETQEHCNRLQQLSRMTGIELGLEEKKLFNLGFASFLHDIGKSKIPTSLLQKPEKLTEDEWDIMKQHAYWGKQIILENFNQKYFERIAEIINQHHEKYDGSGYPHGLSGADILIEAQILSVVDAYDAMINERPYQKALSREEALKEIKSEKGKQFSPKTVEAFLQAEKKYKNKVSK